MQVGDHVIVETARGVEFGRVVLGPKEVGEDEVVHPLKEVLRVATQADEDREKQNRLKEKDAFKICQKKIREHGLEMKLIDAEYTFDNNKVLFYFTADGRIDFRQLVKDLAAIFKTRIELRQIGVRDETKILGGIGICGRCLCCHTYLSEFAPVSIKMAKEQNLSLNPTKISGVCGRLMCCLKNEEDTYEELNRKLPGVGDYVQTADGLHGEVQNVNVLRQLVKVLVEVGEYEADTLQFKRRRGKKGGQELSKEEQKELEKLEEIEEKEEAEERAEKRAEQRPERQDRREQRADSENRGDNRRRDGRRDDNRRNNNRGENQNRNDNRGENRNNENRGDNRRDNNRDTRRDNNRGDRRRENRPQNRPEQVRENSDAQGAEQSGSQGPAPRDNSFRRRPRHGGRRDGNNGNNGNGRKPENTNEG